MGINVIDGIQKRRYKCTTFCHNGGTLLEDCTCKCGYGLTGKFCEQLSLSSHFNDPACGIIRAESEGTLSLSTYPGEKDGRAFCQWLVKPANPWETIEFEFLEMDLNSQDLLTNSDCADSFVVLGSKDIKTQIPCNEKFKQYKNKLYRSDGDWVMFVLNGNSHNKKFRGPLIRYRIVNSSNKEIRSFSLDSFINSASTIGLGLIPFVAFILSF
uniref:CUB domain-containing protein n=1 Tax=Bursaphelenchus xylophilus TaxID=6326 RepID=A0A1I7SID3_BURXY